MALLCVLCCNGEHFESVSPPLLCLCNGPRLFGFEASSRERRCLNYQLAAALNLTVSLSNLIFFFFSSQKWLQIVNHASLFSKSLKIFLAPLCVSLSNTHTLTLIVIQSLLNAKWQRNDSWVFPPFRSLVQVHTVRQNTNTQSLLLLLSCLLWLQSCYMICNYPATQSKAISGQCCCSRHKLVSKKLN